ncbi:hypothetical protein TB2_006797 [Malus domestica]
MPNKQEGEAVPFSSKDDDDEPPKPTTTKWGVTPSKRPNIPVFRYIPILRRMNGQSLFKTGTSKADTQLHKDDVKLLKTNAVLPLTRLGDAKVSKPPQGFVKPLPKGVEPSSLPTKRTEKGFDPNAYKLIFKS